MSWCLNVIKAQVLSKENASAMLQSTIVKIAVFLLVSEKEAIVLMTGERIVFI